MLVIANQHLAGIGGKRSLSGSGKTEENAGIAFFTDIVRAMHRQDIFLRKEIVENGENRFFDLTRIGRTADNHKFFGKVRQYEDFRARSINGRVSLERGHLKDRELRLEIFQLAKGRLYKHVPGKEIVPGAFRDDTDGQAVIWIRAGIAVLNEDFASIQVIEDLRIYRHRSAC